MPLVPGPVVTLYAAVPPPMRGVMFMMISALGVVAMLCRSAKSPTIFIPS